MASEHASATKTGHTPQQGKKYFTVNEANRALPYVSRIVDDIVAAYEHVVELRQQLEATGDDEAVSDEQREYERQMERLGTLVDELQDAGVELKDFEKGLIDFPAVFESREVLLCWHQGEDAVTHWHEVDAGFAGRQDVAQLDDAG